MYESTLHARDDGQPVIGVALGSGAARGWAHIGVLKALADEGIHPDVVCGCSIGALVGASFVSGRLEPLAEWVQGLDWQRVVRMLDISFRGGLIRGDRVLQHCAQHFFPEGFSDLQTPFACVATELSSGREVWLREGAIADAVRASIAMPGLFSPVLRGRRVLLDGGLVNPVPVSLCRALGADIVIAVELGSGLTDRAWTRTPKEDPALEDGFARRLLTSVGLGLGAPDAGVGGTLPLPSLTNVIAASINIMQMRIARSRLAGEPADVLISPRLAQMNMLDFHRAAEAIEEGVAAVERARPLLLHTLDRESPG